MKVHFYSPNRIEPWDFHNLEKGIGGSEVSHIELSWRLAQMGHQVTSYTELPGKPNRWRGVRWRDLSEADLSKDGLWIIYRQPSALRDFEPTSKRKAWLVCQDVIYHDWGPEVEKAERVMALCRTHQAYLEQTVPHLNGNLCLSSNGVRVDLINELPLVERNPKRLIYSSSPDRGLAMLLTIFERAREQVEDLELHIFYGLDNIEMISEKHGSRGPWQASFDTYEKAKKMDGVTWHGRTGQRELYQEFMKSGLWVYPTDFTETSCCSCMEAQAMGAIPITRPYWATLDNVKWGVFIEGSPANDALVRARYVDAIVRVASNPSNQDMIRYPMMEEARQRCDWQRVAEQWHGWISEAV